MTTIILRTFIIYFAVACGIRMTGKRQIGELRLSELITTLLISELAVMPLSDTDIPILHALVPAALIFSLEITIPWLVAKSALLKRIVDGTPSILIRHGVLDTAELAKMRITIEELIAELRLKDIADIADVDYAILEQNGRISVFPKASERPPTAKDMKIKANNTGIAHILISDGFPSKAGLALTGHDMHWLKSKLPKSRTIEDVFLFTVDDAETINIIYKRKENT
ncbi:MAG: DUF421 domain-containing protein [Clostridia bacterium]|nr:DUF421 domain-containing protein [Clostridia bacterium]MBQ4575308.1 DUF421 domain-containing protein [Clostridia bacterium]